MTLEQRIKQLEGLMVVATNKIDKMESLLNECATAKFVLQLEREIDKLEEAVKNLYDNQQTVERLINPYDKPTCKTCNDSGTVMVGFPKIPFPCPDCAKKCQICGGTGYYWETNAPKMCQDCAPKTSCEHEWKKIKEYQDLFECPKCHKFEYRKADPQPERTPDSELEEEIINELFNQAHDGIKGSYVYLTQVEKVLKKLFNG